MCARYSISKTAEEIKARYNLKNLEGYQPIAKTAPGEVLPIITSGQPDQLSFYKWGLVPIWAKDETIGRKMFNARAETLREKPSFRQPFKKKRCLVPVDGFYEWGVEDGKKVPYFISNKKDNLFSLAGLYDQATINGKLIESFTVITRKPTEQLAEIHERMPVIINKDQETDWLDLETDQNYLEYLLKTNINNELIFKKIISK